MSLTSFLRNSMNPMKEIIKALDAKGYISSDDIREVPMEGNDNMYFYDDRKKSLVINGGDGGVVEITMNGKNYDMTRYDDERPGVKNPISQICQDASLQKILKTIEYSF